MGLQYRRVYTKFWRDQYIKRKLDSNETLVCLFLFTNEATTECGIYEVSYDDIAEETKLDVSTVKAAMIKLVEDGRIKYDLSTGEVFIVHWLKHNGNKSPFVLRRIIREMEDVKSVFLREAWHEQAKIDKFPVDAQIEAANPNIKVLAAHFQEVYERVKGTKPPFSKGDFAIAKHALNEHKDNLDLLKNLIEFGVEHLDKKKLTITLKGCLGDWVYKSYCQAWAENKWQYDGLEEAPTNKTWWR